MFKQLIEAVLDKFREELSYLCRHCRYCDGELSDSAREKGWGTCGSCQWKLVWFDEQAAWCGCARPGHHLERCGHCGCGRVCNEACFTRSAAWIN